MPTFAKIDSHPCGSCACKISQSNTLDPHASQTHSKNIYYCKKELNSINDEGGQPLLCSMPYKWMVGYVTYVSNSTAKSIQESSILISKLCPRVSRHLYICLHLIYKRLVYWASRKLQWFKPLNIALIIAPLRAKWVGSRAELWWIWVWIHAFKLWQLPPKTL